MDDGIELWYLVFVMKIEEEKGNVDWGFKVWQQAIKRFKTEKSRRRRR